MKLKVCRNHWHCTVDMLSPLNTIFEEKQETELQSQVGFIYREEGSAVHEIEEEHCHQCHVGTQHNSD